MVDIAVGSTHCLALTDEGEVHSWGSNDKLQHFDTLFSNKKQPKALPGLNSKHIVGVACGPAQVHPCCRAWCRACLPSALWGIVTPSRAQGYESAEWILNYCVKSQVVCSPSAVFKMCP